MIEGDAHGLGGAQRPVGRGLLEELGVVVVGGGVALQEDVGVRVDEAGQEGAATQVDDPRPRGGRGRNLLDPPSLHDHEGGAADLLGGHVEKAVGPNRHHLRRDGEGRGSEGEGHDQEMAAHGATGA